MSWQEQFLAPGSWTDQFLDTEDRVDSHRGTDVARLALPAWENLEVLDSDPTFRYLGHTMLLRADDGMRFGISHCRKGTRAANGAKLAPGAQLALAAMGPRGLAQSNPNFGGEHWYGPHFHITMSRTDPFSGDYAVLLDARPRILALARGETLPSDDIAGFERAPGGEKNAPMWPVGPRMERLQRALAGRTRFGEPSRYDGKIDDRGGTLTAKGIQTTLNISQKNGVKPFVVSPVDGKLGLNNAWGVQWYGLAYGGYQGKMDGDPLALSWDAFIRALELP